MTMESYVAVGWAAGMICGLLLSLLHGNRMYELGRRHGANQEKMLARHRAERDAMARDFAMARIRLTVLNGKLMAINGKRDL